MLTCRMTPLYPLSPFLGGFAKHNDMSLLKGSHFQGKVIQVHSGSMNTLTTAYRWKNVVLTLSLYGGNNNLNMHFWRSNKTFFTVFVGVWEGVRMKFKNMLRCHWNGSGLMTLSRKTLQLCNLGECHRVCRYQYMMFAIFWTADISIWLVCNFNIPLTEKIMHQLIQ